MNDDISIECLEFIKNITPSATHIIFVISFCAISCLILGIIIGKILFGSDKK